MESVTRLQTPTPERARELLGWMRNVQHEEEGALKLDGRGHVGGITSVEDPTAAHLLGDLDVHA
jgi:hypothetical protein